MHNCVSHRVRLALAQLNLAGVHRKFFIPNYGVFDENRYFQTENSTQVFSLDGVKITPKAFGKDRRLPITNKYQESNPPLLVGEGGGEVRRREGRN